MVKLSIFLLYLKLFTPSTTMRHLIYFGMVAIFLIHLTPTALIPAFCVPRGDDSWAAASFVSRCVKGSLYVAAAGAVLVTVSDLYILCLPIPAVWALQLSRKTKIRILMVFMTGAL